MKIKKFNSFKTYSSDLNNIFNCVHVSDNNGKEINLEKSLINLKKKINKNKVFLIGNGGSSSNCDHISNDYSKILKAKCINLYGSGIFTCYSNDYGYDNVFSEQLKALSKKNDTLICLSCSGESKNLINAIKVARKNKLSVVTLTGINSKNKVKAMGDLNYFINHYSYGLIEIAHLTLLHYIVEN